jgi:hypothetical protein
MSHPSGWRALRAAAPPTMADIQGRLDQLAQARRDIRPGGDVPLFCRRVADLWADEAQAWAELPGVADFPLGTPSGVLLARAADAAHQFADRRATSWKNSSGCELAGTP